MSTPPRSKHGTLTANVVTAVDVTTSGRPFQIVNRSQTGEIWVRFDGVDPVVEADETFVVLGARQFYTNGPKVNVKLLSTAALKYSVEGYEWS